MKWGEMKMKWKREGFIVPYKASTPKCVGLFRKTLPKQCNDGWFDGETRWYENEAKVSG